ncbi:ANK-REP-REGION domain-containing protein [Mycena chlorophos]|uniref:ANK-REP-REGION domain-containing protein n=1 Tax=Mycena chlorophos TaxID=658473 RepID=A0A8H6SU18_MYCCL|nr:ANK-REP-REGION domain-containing protein [Mycena chlorophos]
MHPDPDLQQGRNPRTQLGLGLECVIVAMCVSSEEDFLALKGKPEPWARARRRALARARCKRPGVPLPEPSAPGPAGSPAALLVGASPIPAGGPAGKVAQLKTPEPEVIGVGDDSFLVKLYRLADDPANASIIRWEGDTPESDSNRAARPGRAAWLVTTKARGMGRGAGLYCEFERYGFRFTPLRIRIRTESGASERRTRAVYAWSEHALRTGFKLGADDHWHVKPIRFSDALTRDLASRK